MNIIIFIIATLFLSIGTNQVGKESGYIKGCTAAYADLYTEMGISPIDKVGLETFCKEKMRNEK